MRAREHWWPPKYATDARIPDNGLLQSELPAKSCIAGMVLSLRI